MMTLQEVYEVIDTLSPDELHILRDYIDQRAHRHHPQRGLTPEDRIQRLDDAAAIIREGMSPTELENLFSQ